MSVKLTNHWNQLVNFSKFSIDLIYGMPYSSLTNWKNNLEIALSYNPPHIFSLRINC